MNKRTISMTSTQLRKLIDSTPANADKVITPEKVEILARRKGSEVFEVVISAIKNGALWEVTAPAGLIKTV